MWLLRQSVHFTIVSVAMLLHFIGAGVRHVGFAKEGVRKGSAASLAHAYAGQEIQSGTWFSFLQSKGAA